LIELDARLGSSVFTAANRCSKSRGAFHIQAGSLFAALHRLEQEGWISGEWTTNDKARRIKSYCLTTAGKRQFTEEKRTWERVVAAVKDDLNDEMQAYVEGTTERKIREGLAPEAAREAALLEIGSLDRMKDLIRQQHIGFGNTRRFGITAIVAIDHYESFVFS
jgi:DNA-binding PadR family transcriptional regulator